MNVAGDIVKRCPRDYSEGAQKDGPGGAANAVILALTPDYTGGST